ncbi:hypothetical protein E2P84_30385 [Burkholderia cepacia]|uniref:Uncharacterized protein n=1 Tax=Burkholderia cepacia TaxID=292 RepID=A0AAX2RCY1_BURCE|nr:hypothetical protein E2P84_30385 [Burkholderia cepacia]TES97515.1 hypothetical protein E3D36_32080 [Burkholderia cepacia]TEU33386.1 hypothetical protein E3D39_33760 [Burkholderia cepacia]TEU35416.1 hypothetical protein E3D37_37415 [Burkholderia cepacia]TEU40924.1 hypothetical protein E3D38_33755 [Burkholderia cepacia]
MRCPEKGRSRGARRREYWTYSQGVQRGERPFSGQPLIGIVSTGRPEIARMAASVVACLARPNGAPPSLPCERFRAFACVFHR